MKLSQRLQAIYNLVNSPCILADIGTDHGHLPIALVLDGKAIKAYACDVALGPLSRAKEAIQKANVEDKVQTRLQNGLSTLPNDVTSIVIAGMGSETIINILENDIEYAKKCPQLILQSNSHVDVLRKWLNEHDFQIIHEELVYEHHYYQILHVKYGKQNLSEEQILFGYDLYQHPLFEQWILFQRQSISKILKNLAEEHKDYHTLHQSMIMMDKVLKKDCFTQSL